MNIIIYILDDAPNNETPSRQLTSPSNEKGKSSMLLLSVSVVVVVVVSDTCRAPLGDMNPQSHRMHIENFLGQLVRCHWHNAFVFSELPILLSL